MIFRMVAVLCMVAGMAVATPERLTSSHDRLIAATQSHVYVLRDIIDNLGSHYHGLHDQHLIEISLESGEATRYWPLRYMNRDYLAGGNDFLLPGKITEREGDVRDMMQILREQGAEPVLPSRWAVQDFALEGGGLNFKGQQVLTPFAIRVAGRAQLAILRDAYPQIDPDADTLAHQIMFYDLYTEGEWHCELGTEGQTLTRATDRIYLVPLYCDDNGVSGNWVFHAITLKPLE